MDGWVTLERFALGQMAKKRHFCAWDRLGKDEWFRDELVREKSDFRIKLSACLSICLFVRLFLCLSVRFLYVNICLFVDRTDADTTSACRRRLF